MQWPEREEGKPYRALEVLGELAPLVVLPLAAAVRRPSTPPRLAMAPDAAAKAFYSGDWDYLRLPSPDADTRLDPSGEYFVAHLRTAFRNGGFGSGWALREPPPLGLKGMDLSILEELARGLEVV